MWRPLSWKAVEGIISISESLAADESSRKDPGNAPGIDLDEEASDLTVGRLVCMLAYGVKPAAMAGGSCLMPEVIERGSALMAASALISVFHGSVLLPEEDAAKELVVDSLPKVEGGGRMPDIRLKALFWVIGCVLEELELADCG